MKKFLSVLIALSLMLPVLAAPATAEEEHEPITIRISWWGDTARHEKYNKFVDAFEEAYPWITVERESSTWADYWNKLATLVAGGNAPDVMGMHPQFASDYANRGALLNLDKLIADGIVSVADIPESVVEGGRVSGNLCMVSMGVTVQCNLINETLLEQIGFEYPMDKTLTWAEFGQLALDFRAKALEKGIDAYLTGEWRGFPQFQYMARANGGDLYTADGALGFTQADLEEWLTFWKDLRDADAIPDAATTTESASLTLEQSLFCTHVTAMTSVPANQLWQYAAQLPDEKISAVYMPVGNDGTTGAFLEGAHWAISSAIDEKHQEAAGLLLNFIVNSEGAAQYMLMDQGVPANTKMAEYIMPMLDEYSIEAVEFVQRVTAMVEKGINYAPKGAGSIDTAFKEACESVAFEVMTPAEAAATFMEQASAVIAENK